MISRKRNKLSIRLSCLLCCSFLGKLHSFSVSRRQQSLTLRRMSSPWPMNAVIDPATMADATSQTQQQLNYEQYAEALLNTMYSTTNLMPAQGHSNPLFGPPDPLLQAGKSIAPSAKSLLDMGISKTSVAPQDVPVALQTAISKSGYKLLDAKAMISESVMPGFQANHGWLPEHSAMVPAENSPEAYAVMVDWSVNFLQIVEKLPYIAIAYVMVDFFILRPNLDWYKEELEIEPTQALSETMSSTFVRMGIFMVLATLTMTFFG
ncbi:hypothetical protein MPSEU_000392600 [Mayamaea pseudoterrestris]|nr:hypothetical protein MPSEU_000392600 [Mayamaea pseudoterrestris]